MKKIEIILLALIIIPLVILGTNFYNDYIISLISIISLILILIPIVSYFKKMNKIMKYSAEPINQLKINQPLSYIEGIYKSKLLKTENIITPYGLSIEISRLIKNNCISVDIDETKTDEKEKMKLKFIKNEINKANYSDKLIINMLRSFNKKEINLNYLDKEFNKKSTKNRFNIFFNKWASYIESNNNVEKYIIKKDKNLFILITIIIMLYTVITLIILLNHNAPYSYYLIQVCLLLTYLYSLAHFDEIFGRYSEKGIEILSRIESLKTYLSTPNLIKENPPKDWELYLLLSACFNYEKNFYKTMNQIKNYEKNDFHIFIENNGIQILSEIFKKAGIYRNKFEKQYNSDENIGELLPKVYPIDFY